MNRNGFIVVEGNIGVGKSTFCRYLTEAFQRAGYTAEMLTEPDEKNNPFLADYYAAPRENAYKMQMFLLHRRYTSTMFAQWAAHCGRGVFVMDRSYFGDLCFANVQKKFGYFSADEFAAYREAHIAMRHSIEAPTLAIFLTAPIDVIQSRIARRNRTCESGIDPAYLEALDIEIDNLFDSMYQRGPAMQIEWERDLTDEQIKDFCDDFVKTYLPVKNTFWEL